MTNDLIQDKFLESLQLRKNYDLFGDIFTADLHWGKLFIHLFGEYFSRYRINRAVKNEELIKCLIQKFNVNPKHILRFEETQQDDSCKIDYDGSEVLLILKDGLLLGIRDNCIEIIYGLAISEAERQEIIQIVDGFLKPVTRKFHMVQYYKGSFSLAHFDVKSVDLDIETHYNNDFLGMHDLIFDSLKAKNKNGLVLLHGKYGSGKTYYLRHLISNIDRKFIYFPLDMVEVLNSPEFLPFISGQPNSVLILEDCESILVPRENGSNNASALSNLLNLGDGLLSDALSVNVICTFNAGIKKIDDAILRKGRLLARYEFKELEMNKAQALANKIGKNIIVDRPMTVSDIYNADEKSFENNPVKSVGFKVA